MNQDGYLGYWIAIEPVAPRPTMNRCPCMRRVWELMAVSRR